MNISSDLLGSAAIVCQFSSKKYKVHVRDIASGIDMVVTQRFPTHQMSGYFDTMDNRYFFPDPLCQDIMLYHLEYLNQQFDLLLTRKSGYLICTCGRDGSRLKSSRNI